MSEVGEPPFVCLQLGRLLLRLLRLALLLLALLCDELNLTDHSP